MLGEIEWFAGVVGRIVLTSGEKLEHYFDAVGIVTQLRPFHLHEGDFQPVEDLLAALDDETFAAFDVHLENRTSDAASDQYRQDVIELNRFHDVRIVGCIVLLRCVDLLSTDIARILRETQVLPGLSEESVLDEHHSIGHVRQLNRPMNAHDVRSKALDAQDESAESGRIHRVGADVGADVDQVEMGMTNEKCENTNHTFLVLDRRVGLKGIAHSLILRSIVYTDRGTNQLQQCFSSHARQIRVDRLLEIHRANVGR